MNQDFEREWAALARAFALRAKAQKAGAYQSPRDAIQDLLYEISVGLESGDASEEELARWEESLLGLGATGYDEDGPPEGLEEIVRDLYERVRSARRRWWQFWRSTEPPSQSGR